MLKAIIQYTFATMFRIVTAILLIVAIAAQTFNQAVIVLDYYVNTASFAKNCENKVKPIMKCRGKCQMMKKIKETEQKDQQNPERKLENRNEVVSSKSWFPSVVINIDLFERHNYPSYHRSLLSGTYSETFHPPGLV
jgi:hypothetical protein